MKRRYFILLALLPVLLIAVALFFRAAYRPQPIQLQGQIEAQQYMVSSKVAGRLAEVFVRRGDSINKGDPVFVIDSPELEARLTQVQAIDRIASSLAQAVDQGTREEQIAAARSEWEKAKAAAELAEKSWRRLKPLAEQGVVSEQRYDEAYTQWQVALKTEISARELLKKAESGPRGEARAASRASEEATASLAAQVEELLRDRRINAYHSGIVTEVLLNPGELVPQGFPVVMITDLSDAWALFNVREDLLAKLPLGATFQLEVPALGKRVEFAVSHVAVLGDFATWRATSASRGFDMRTFEVEMRPTSPVEDLYPGMSVLLQLEP